MTQTQAAQNKQLIEHLYAELADGNRKPFRDCMADDIVWRVLGTTRWSRTYSSKRAVIDDLLTPVQALFADRFKATVTRIVAEDDYLSVETRGTAMTKAGAHYDNTYCMIMRLADGKICEVTEYLDTALVDAVL